MTTGKVVNLMSSDATRMQWSGGYLHWLPCAFVQVVIGMCTCPEIHLLVCKMAQTFCTQTCCGR